MNTFKPKTYEKFNAIGFFTLYKKEVHRFTSILAQTIIAPMITSVLFLSVFHLSIGSINMHIGNLTFLQFLVPGLIMMTIIQNAFSNASSSIVSGKMLGSIIDIIMPPLSNFEILLALTLAGITRGLCVGLASFVALSILTDVTVYNIFYALVIAVISGGLMSTIGVLAGVWSDKWDDISAINNYVIMPMSFLSCTFYSIERLSPTIQQLVLINPFFYMIDGFRYAITGYSDANPTIGLLYLLGLFIVFSFIAYRLLVSGYKIRS